MKETEQSSQSVYEQIKKNYRETMEILRELKEGNRTENAEQ